MKKGAYFLTVKGNQEGLRFRMAAILRHSAPQDLHTVETIERKHGRLERRILVVRTVPAGEDWGWPGGCQIGSIRRIRLNPRTGQVLSDETIYFITSLTPAQATPAQLLALARGQLHHREQGAPRARCHLS